MNPSRSLYPLKRGNRSEALSFIDCSAKLIVDRGATNTRGQLSPFRILLEISFKIAVLFLQSTGLRPSLNGAGSAPPSWNGRDEVAGDTRTTGSFGTRQEDISLQVPRAYCIPSCLPACRKPQVQYGCPWGSRRDRSITSSPPE